MELIDNIHIKQLSKLISPRILRTMFPATDGVHRLVRKSRESVQAILAGKNNRLLVIVGPCSLHDPQATLMYAEKLSALQKDIGQGVQIVMRAYVEKPRTNLGWKGMIYDPHLDHSYDIKAGLKMARSLFLDILKRGVPIATEFLDPIVPQYLADLVTWAAIGARTTESQIHRQMVSGLSMPIGFKNGTDGDLTCAIDAIKTAASAHAFMGVNREGEVAIAETRGNPYCHLVLRGGEHQPNYSAEHMAYATTLLAKNRIRTRLLVDCSHANSSKDYTRQGAVCQDVAGQIRAGNQHIAGVMLESFLEAGNQPFDCPEQLKPGLSITDACIGWEETERLVREFTKIYSMVSCASR